MPNQKKSYFLNNMKMFFQLRNFLRPAAQIHNLQSKKKKKKRWENACSQVLRS